MSLSFEVVKCLGSRQAFVLILNMGYEHMFVKQKHAMDKEGTVSSVFTLAHFQKNSCIPDQDFRKLHRC